MNLKCRLSADDLIELAETGKVRNIELDDMAKEVFNECAYMLNFEKKYYERERKREQKKQKA